MQPTRINLVSIVKKINDLHRELEPPKIHTIIIHPDYILLYWHEIEREQWGSLPYKIPFISNTKIEYKKMYDSIWNKIDTNHDTTTSCCLYKQNPIHKFSKSHIVDNFWNEYNAIEEDFLYDIRICFENYKHSYHWSTLSSIGISSLPPTFVFCGFLSKHIESPIPNQCYLVIENNDPYWKEYQYCIALYNNATNHSGWVIYYPRKGWLIDDFYFDGIEWIDYKLKNILVKLNNIISSKDIIFKIINYKFSSRFLNKNIMNTYYQKYIVN
jgi:hypothetical protein